LDRAAKSIANPELKIRLQRIGSQGRSILNQIADRPTDLFRARKFLSVYLDGVQQVADGYARTHRLADSRELEQNFRNVLVTVEQVFDEQHQRLAEDRRDGPRYPDRGAEEAARARRDSSELNRVHPQRRHATFRATRAPRSPDGLGDARFRPNSRP
jgi:hypothetical protein